MCVCGYLHEGVAYTTDYILILIAIATLTRTHSFRLRFQKERLLPVYSSQDIMTILQLSVYTIDIIIMLIIIM